MIIYENELTAEQHVKIQEAVGFGTANIEQTRAALKSSLYRVSVQVEDEIVGMGRIVGDGARIFYIQDLFIMPKCQGQGIGRIILEKLLVYIKGEKNKYGYSVVTIGLMAAKGKDEFYKKFGFRARPNDKEGSGMVINLYNE